MVARTTRRVAPTPAPTGSTPFADAALELYQAGLAVIPLRGDPDSNDDADRKRRKPRVKFKGQKHRFGCATLKGFVNKYPSDNIGILPGLCALTVVDIDNAELVDAMVNRFGDTPLKVRTPSDGVHLYYCSSGERCRNLRHTEGLEVDIKGIGGMVVVPPSIRPDRGNKAYTFLAGSWSDFRRLPKIKAGALKAETPAPVMPELQEVPKGHRNNSLFNACLDQAPYCVTLDDLKDVALAIAAEKMPGLPKAEVLKTAESAWSYHVNGRNYRANRSHGAQEVVSERLLDRFQTDHPRYGADALTLYVKLRCKHAARDKRGKPFPIAADAMAKEKVIPWSAYRFRNAIRTLVDFGWLERVKTGGRGEGDVHLYRFRSPPPILVLKIDI